MTTADLKAAGLGRGYWAEYVRLNGYAFAPTDEGLRKLARFLDLTRAHVARCINLYLSA